MSLIHRLIRPAVSRTGGRLPANAATSSLFLNDPFFQSSPALWPLSTTSDLLSAFNALPEPASWPQWDLSETKDSFIVKANVPGFTKENLDISADGSRLIIKGKMEESSKSPEKEDETQHVQERWMSSSFERSLDLGSDKTTLDIEGIKASLKDGVLNITVPKKEVAEPLGKKIQIASE